MKKLLVPLIFFIITIASLAQEKVPFIDYDEIAVEVSKFADKGDYDKTIEILDRLNKNDSTYCATLVSKSYYLLNSEKYEEVIKVIDEGFNLNCNTQYLSYYVNRGLAYLNLQKHDEALNNYNKALEIYPKNYLLWYNKGVVLEEMGKIEDAIKAYQEAILLRPTYARPHLQLGNLCYKQERITQALMCF